MLKLPAQTFSVGTLGSTDPKYQEWAQNFAGVPLVNLPDKFEGTKADSDMVMNKIANIPGGAQQPTQGAPLTQGTAPIQNTGLVSTDLKFGEGGLKLNPILESFSKFLPSTATGDWKASPQFQAKLFDLDNLIKAQAGIYRMNDTEGLKGFGTDFDGTSLFTSTDNDDMRNNFGIGDTTLNNLGTILDTLGAFRSPEEAQSFVNNTKLAGSPEFAGELTGIMAKDGKAAAINHLLSSTGNATLDKLDGKDFKSMSAAFGAYNTVNNWDKMNAGQRSLSVAGLGMATYRYATGESLGARVLIGNEDTPKLTVGTALGLASAGVDVSTLMKNWDQYDTLGRLVMGANSASQIAVVAKQLGVLGPAENMGAAVKISAEQLGAAGFAAAPSMGVGAIVGPANSVPAGYVTVATGTAPNTVVAVPKGSEGTITKNPTSLNNVSGAALAALGAYQIYQNWGKGGAAGAVNGVVGGSVMNQGIAQLGQTNPYMGAAIVALSVLGGTVKNDTASKAVGAGLAGTAGYAAYQAATAGTSAAAAGANAAAGAADGAAGAAGSFAGLASVAAAGYGAYQAYRNSNMSGEQKARTIRQTAERAAASYATAGVSELVLAADKKFLGGTVNKAYQLADKLDLENFVFDKVAGSVLGKVGGGRSKDRMMRDQARKGFQQVGIIDENWEVTLADGSRVSAGLDKNDGQHEFADPSLIPVGNENRTLSAYDVDYTNDLDYTSSLMTSSLARLLGGGKNQGLDQVAGQLANSALGNVGYGQPMTPETFTKVRDNVRVWFAQSGLSTKEDAYALANQAYAEQRISEMDLSALHQGLNLVFDPSEQAYASASQLMEGRFNGIQLASNPKTPVQGPVLDMELDTDVFLKQAAEIANSLVGSAGVQNMPDGSQPMTDVNQINAALSEQLGSISPPLKFTVNPGSYGSAATSGLYREAYNSYQSPYAQFAEQTLTRQSKYLSQEELRQQNIQRFAR
jgi:hypothetical protein